MGTQALIQATALNRFYGHYQAVKDYNLTLHKGDVLGLLGPNGAGKSSTMQMLTGNLSPSSGDILINGVDLINEPEKAKRSIGYLPETPPVYADMTVCEYLRYCGKLQSIEKNRLKSAVEEAQQRCGLQDVPNKLIGNLSKGFQQRVGIAQAILHKPDVVILDEPTVGLDPIQITQIRELIRELGKDHGVILSTHILPEVQAVCDRVQIIHQGSTVFSDSFSALSEGKKSQQLVVSFAQGGDSEVISAMASVAEVKELQSQDQSKQFNVTFDPAIKTGATEIFNLAVEKGWVINELSSNNETLEQIFMNLIHLESPDIKTKNIAKSGGVS